MAPFPRQRDPGVEKCEEVSRALACLHSLLSPDSGYNVTSCFKLLNVPTWNYGVKKYVAFVRIFCYSNKKKLEHSVCPLGISRNPLRVQMESIMTWC